MKIAYVLDWDIVNQSSVLSKIEKKIAYWELNGYEVCFMIVSYQTQQEYVPHVSNLKIFERPDLSFLRFSSLQTFFGRNIAFGRMLKELKSYSPDIVYLRPGSMWYPNVSKIVESYNSVLELNSIDEEEVKLYYPNGDFRYKVFKYGRRRLLRKCNAIICLTDEIKNYYKSYNKKVVVISNGVLFDNASFDFEENQDINVLFVGTPSQPWQGFDQFVSMANLLPEYQFHLVGPSADSFSFDLPRNLTCYGFLSRNNVAKLFKKCCVGVGTLSLYKKNMQEACPLKVREYVASGMYLILGYKDTDFHGCDFALYIGNHQRNIQENVDEMRRFIEKSARSNHYFENLDAEKYSVEGKENSRLFFLENVATRQPV